MSKQLLLSASISVLAMAIFALAGAPALAGDSASGTQLLSLHTASAAMPALSDLLPLLAPAGQ